MISRERTGQERQGERPFQLQREHRVGEPRRKKLHPPRPHLAGRQSGPRKLVGARGGERRQPMAVGASFDRRLQGFVARDFQNLGGAFDLRAPLARGRCRQRAPGEEPTSGGSGVGAGAGQMEGVAQRRSVLAATCARHAGGGGCEREPLAPDVAPGRVFADDRVEARERRAGEKGRFRLSFRWISGAPRRGAASRRAAQRPGFPAN